MNNASPQTAETRDGASPDGTRVATRRRRLGRYPIRDYALTRPCCLRQPEDSRRPSAIRRQPLSYRSAGSVWTPLGLDESIRTLGPIVDDTASDLM